MPSLFAKGKVAKCRARGTRVNTSRMSEVQRHCRSLARNVSLHSPCPSVAPSALCDGLPSLGQPGRAYTCAAPQARKFMIYEQMRVRSLAIPQPSRRQAYLLKCVRSLASPFCQRGGAAVQSTRHACEHKAKGSSITIMKMSDKDSTPGVLLLYETYR